MASERNRLVLGRVVFRTMLLVWAIGLFIVVDAQTSTVGNISGTVRDPTGAVVPGPSSNTGTEDRILPQSRGQRRGILLRS